MKYLAIVAAGLVLAACETVPGMPTVFGGGGGPARRRSTRPGRRSSSALVEQSGLPGRSAGPRASCMTPASPTWRSATSASRSPPTASAEIGPDGGLMLLTEHCI